MLTVQKAMGIVEENHELKRKVEILTSALDDIECGAYTALQCLHNNYDFNTIDWKLQDILKRVDKAYKEAPQG